MRHICCRRFLSGQAVSRTRDMLLLRLMTRGDLVELSRGGMSGEGWQGKGDGGEGCRVFLDEADWMCCVDRRDNRPVWSSKKSVICVETTFKGMHKPSCHGQFQ